MSETVHRRSREIGIRLALGAGQARIASAILWHGLRVALLGGAIGLAISLSMGHALEKLLFGVEPLDLRITMLALTALLLTTAAASFLPAWRAARLNPAAILKFER